MNPPSWASAGTVTLLTGHPLLTLRPPPQLRPLTAGLAGSALTPLSKVLGSRGDKGRPPPGGGGGGWAQNVCHRDGPLPAFCARDSFSAKSTLRPDVLQPFWLITSPHLKCFTGEFLLQPPTLSFTRNIKKAKRAPRSGLLQGESTLTWQLKAQTPTLPGQHPSSPPNLPAQPQPATGLCDTSCTVAMGFSSCVIS